MVTSFTDGSAHNAPKTSFHRFMRCYLFGRFEIKNAFSKHQSLIKLCTQPTTLPRRVFTVSCGATTVRNASDFTDMLRVQGVDVAGYHILRVEDTAVPNSIAALLLHIRDITGKRPHAYFNWTEGNPFKYLIRYVLSGKGDVAPVTREVLRQAERNPERRPVIHAAM